MSGLKKKEKEKPKKVISFYGFVLICCGTWD